MALDVKAPRLSDSLPVQSDASEASSEDKVSLNNVSLGIPRVEQLHITRAGLEAVEYKLYRRRFLGLIGLVRAHEPYILALSSLLLKVLLNLVTAMSWPWFGPISNNSKSKLKLP
ncbi:hypothetical protein H0H81_006704 [Sphagnurus paluster]|uniref:Uncharacterized protein n=1 Tax=Sphagnurus paluster TaxID=117069 RepID=A0A9P7G1G8_9AGAR|nr:hypothetical protein H0H81_006704 [Sphagnurus paluster]